LSWLIKGFTTTCEQRKGPFVTQILDAAWRAEYTWLDFDYKNRKIKFMWTRMGIWCLLGAFFIGLFNGISTLMKVDNFWAGLTLSRLLGDYADTVITVVPVQAVENTLYFLVEELPFFGFVLGVGTLFLIVGMFVKVRS
jgi:hypothetical protein